jgi:hypothetical protein
MKTIIKESLKKLFEDKYLFILSIVMLLTSIIFAIIISASVHPSELQLVSHYSAYGVTHLYRDQWFYLYSFVVFDIVVALLHILISIKLLIVKGHSFAITYAWIGMGVLVIGLITALSVLNIWKPV